MLVAIIQIYNSKLIIIQIARARKKNGNIILMGCPCHIGHSTAKKAMDAFSKINHFSIEKLLVDIYFHFDYSSKRKNPLVNSVTRTIARFRNSIVFCD